MNGRNAVLKVIIVVLIGMLAIASQAQASNGTLALGQPVIVEVAAGSTAVYDYTLAEARVVTLQALGQGALPTLAIQQGDRVIAAEANSSGSAVVSLTHVLDAGSYTIVIGATNGSSGTIALQIQSETPVQVIELTPGSGVEGQVNTDTSTFIYGFSAVNELSFLSIYSGLPDRMPAVSLFNETGNVDSGNLSGDLVGGTFFIGAGSDRYRLTVTTSDTEAPQPFTLCWVTISTGGCTNLLGVATEQPSAPVDADVCRVTGSGVNVRASASTQAPIIGALSQNESADVLGISPDGTFYNIQYLNGNGWVSVGVVTVSGNCAGIVTIQPPAFVPVTTPVPVQPTNPPPLLAATQVPLPLVPTIIATPSGPCLLTLNSPTKVYTTPTEQIDFLFDQLQSGELIPVGRLADNSWWKTNYANAWVQTSLIGTQLTRSGNCSNLPIVTP